MQDAQLLLENMDHTGAAYFAEQSAEKIAKCVLILDNRFGRTHHVSKLFSEVVDGVKSPWKKRLEELPPLLDELEEYGVLSRYPEPRGKGVWNPQEEYSREDAGDAVEKARRVCEEIRLFLEEQYEIIICWSGKKGRIIYERCEADYGGRAARGCGRRRPR